MNPFHLQKILDIMLASSGGVKCEMKPWRWVDHSGGDNGSLSRQQFLFTASRGLYCKWGLCLRREQAMWLKWRSATDRITANHEPLLERHRFTPWGRLHWPASSLALFYFSSFQLKGHGILQRTLESVCTRSIVCNLDKLYASVSTHNWFSSRYRCFRVAEFMADFF